MSQQLLGLHYNVTQKLGTSLSTPSFLVCDLQDQQKIYVIKEVHPAVTDPLLLETVRQLVEQEKLKLTSLNDLGCFPKLVNSFEENQAFYFVYEYIKGVSLQEKIASQVPYSEASTISLLLEVLKILEIAHKRNIIHQNIKPENIIYRQSDGQVFLVGLGEIRNIGNNLAVTIPTNSCCYLAPEQLRNSPQKNSDLYSLGIVAIQVLTGIDPINFFENSPEICLQKFYGYEHSPLLDILVRMVKPIVKERYSCAEDVIVSLEKLGSASFPTEILGTVSSSPTLERSPSSIGQPSPSIPDPSPSSPSLSVTQPAQILSSPPILPTQVQSSLKSGLIKVQKSTSSPLQLITHFFYSSNGKILVLCLGVGLLITLSIYSVDWYKKHKIAEAIAAIETLYRNGEYQKCIGQSKSPDVTRIGIPPQTILELSSRCELAIAVGYANQLKYDEALLIIVKISADSPHYEQAQSYLDNWSSQILDKADRFYKTSGDLTKALELIKSIPETSSIKKKALDLAEQWKTDYDGGRKVIISVPDLLR
jgi:serine/threonine-protein kinase